MLINNPSKLDAEQNTSRIPNLREADWEEKVEGESASTGRMWEENGEAEWWWKITTERMGEWGWQIESSFQNEEGQGRARKSWNVEKEH